jgi:hypothetical protein
MVTTPNGIADNGFGFVTRFGAVRGLDASGGSYSETWAEGDKLYLSSTTPGAITNVSPSSNLSVLVGIVINNSATVGVIGIDPRNPIDTTATLGTSNLVAPTQDAVKTYVDTAVTKQAAIEAFTLNDTTPSVSTKASLYTFTIDSALTVTDFDDGVAGQEITVTNPTGAFNVTIDDGANILLNGTADMVLTINDTLTLIYNGSVWIEIARSVR